MIPTDETTAYDPDCATCIHRVMRHTPRHIPKGKTREHSWVCLVTAKPISIHGVRTTMQRPVEGGIEWFWAYEPPCKRKGYVDGEPAMIAADWDGTEESYLGT